MGWWASLRGRIFLVLAALALITVAGGVVTIWYTHQMQSLFSESIEKEVAEALQVEALLQALMKQKGYVSYYLIDRNEKWLARLGEERDSFQEHLRAARELASTAEERTVLQQIERKYDKYVASKDRVIELYESGERHEGQLLHEESRTHFEALLDLCKTYETMRIERLHRTQQKSREEAGRMRAVSATAVMVTIILFLLLGYVLVRQIFGPIRRMLEDAERFGGTATSPNEVKALGRGVRGLIENADQTHQELEKSRMRLLQTEKMATVGRLASGVAHSIRNPLTSIKMRLFSLERSLELASNEREDLEVISEETRHLETIIRNFLEYARPSKLRMQRISPSELIDVTLQLLRHRFKSYGVRLELIRTVPLPEVLADPDQFKEVFVNILINACEAVGEGGTIRIEEEIEMQEPLGPVAVIRISDDGPGVPADLQEKVFEPFFSTKEEGTGLGLSIAVRVIEQHGGRLAVKSGEGQGTTFIITLPCREDKSWAQS